MFCQKEILKKILCGIVYSITTETPLKWTIGTLRSRLGLNEIAETEDFGEKIPMKSEINETRIRLQIRGRDMIFPTHSVA